MRYKEIETLRDPDGLIAVITERTDTGHLSFRIQKEFVSNNEIKATSYMGVRHIDAVIRLCHQLRDRLDIHTDRAKIQKHRLTAIETQR